MTFGEGVGEMIGTGGAAGLVRVAAHGKTTARDVNDSLCLLLARKEFSCSFIIGNVVIFGIFGGKRKQEARGGAETPVSK